jgi:RND family efflux transporter MFP subunit
MSNNKKINNNSKGIKRTGFSEVKPEKRKFKKKGSKTGKMILWLFLGLVIMFIASRFNVSIFDIFKKKTVVEEQQEEVKELPLVKVFHIVKTDFKDFLPVVGTVKGFKEIDMKFPNAGKIKSINFMEGDLIGEGEVLAELDQKEAELKIDYQKANFEGAKSAFIAASKKLANAQKMFNIGAIYVSKLDEAIMEADEAIYKMNAAKVELDSAVHEIEKNKLTSIISGVIGILNMEAGEFATNSDKVLILIDIAQVYVELGIIEKDIDKVAIGLSAEVLVDAYPDMIFEGEIENILPIIEGKSRTLTVKVLIDNDQNLLLPGMFARGNIAVFEDKDTIMIPTKALNKTKDGYSVNVIDPENNVETRVIEIGYITTDYVQVLSGLEPDEFVVIEVHEELKDGDKVQIVEVQESTLK